MKAGIRRIGADHSRVERLTDTELTAEVMRGYRFNEYGVQVGVAATRSELRKRGLWRVFKQVKAQIKDPRRE